MIKDLIRFLLFLVPCIVITGLEGIIFGKVTIFGYELNFRKRESKKEIEEKILVNYLKKCHKREKDDKKDNGKTQGNG